MDFLSCVFIAFCLSDMFGASSKPCRAKMLRCLAVYYFNSFIFDKDQVLLSFVYVLTIFEIMFYVQIRFG